MAYAMLTTIDNPYDPFTDYDRWLEFDEEKGYFTNSYPARIVKTSDALSEKDIEKDIEDAIDEIVKLNVLGIYKKVFENENKKLNDTTNTKISKEGEGS